MNNSEQNQESVPVSSLASSAIRSFAINEAARLASVVSSARAAYEKAWRLEMAKNMPGNDYNYLVTLLLVTAEFEGRLKVGWPELTLSIICDAGNAHCLPECCTLPSRELTHVDGVESLRQALVNADNAEERYHNANRKFLANRDE